MILMCHINLRIYQCKQCLLLLFNLSILEDHFITGTVYATLIKNFLSINLGVLRTLPETSNLPSVFMFAECILSSTRQTRSLPSAALKTLGKNKHSVNRRFTECKKTLGKDRVCRVFFFTLGKEVKIFFLGKKEKKKNKKNFAECPDLGHSAKK